AEVATILFALHLNFYSKDPKWKNRDRFVLSAGHGSMLIYSILYLLGYEGVTLNDLKNFRKIGYPTAGHPEVNEIPGIETTTGPLGQGLANAVGIAISEKIIRNKLGKDSFNHFTYVLVGDGCIMEGISHEAASLAGHLSLSNLIVLYDDNEISIDGPTSLTMSDKTLERFSSYGWHTENIDGYDLDAINSAIENAKKDNRPSIISCKTLIGYGSPNKQGTAGSHGSPLGEKEVKLVRESMNWNYQPFEIPEDIIEFWRISGLRNKEVYESWIIKNENKLKDFQISKDDFIEKVINARKKSSKFFAENKSEMATRKSSEIVISHLMNNNLNLLGGSADLTGSNNTYVKQMKVLDKKNFTGNYIHWGVREHCMAAAMNGISLHGFFVPYGGTFLVFSDYCRPALRLAALMKQKVVFVFTHDSIGLGEDGPTHQPVEHLSSLRVIPNLNIFRPADSIETSECWELALLSDSRPSVIALSRQNLPLLRCKNDNFEINLSKKGAYILIDKENPHVTIIASGSEVALAKKVSEELVNKQIHIRVVSMPSMELFDQQNHNYKSLILDKTKNIFLEAGSMQSWNKWMRNDDVFIGLDDFGASGPGEDVYKHFKISIERIKEEIAKIIKK
ncbi:MAG: hypothetical protein CFH34_01283, partial [Alphaproteobacteria bacterium MarineAlpha9_Bin4]